MVVTVACWSFSIPSTMYLFLDWSFAGSLAIPRSLFTASILPEGTVFVADGCSDQLISDSETYDPLKKTWSDTSDPDVHRCGHAATVFDNGKVLITSGNS